MIDRLEIGCIKVCLKPRKFSNASFRLTCVLRTRLATALKAIRKSAPKQIEDKRHVSKALSMFSVRKRSSLADDFSISWTITKLQKWLASLVVRGFLSYGDVQN